MRPLETVCDHRRASHSEGLHLTISNTPKPQVFPEGLAGAPAPPASLHCHPVPAPSVPVILCVRTSANQNLQGILRETYSALAALFPNIVTRDTCLFVCLFLGVLPINIPIRIHWKHSILEMVFTTRGPNGDNPPRRGSCGFCM